MPSHTNRTTPATLQLFNPDCEYNDSSSIYCEPVSVSVKANDVLPLLVDAALTNRAWLEDFADDAIQIPQDLYEVLLAYKRYRNAA